MIRNKRVVAFARRVVAALRSTTAPRPRKPERKRKNTTAVVRRPPAATPRPGAVTSVRRSRVNALDGLRDARTGGGRTHLFFVMEEARRVDAS